MAIPVVLLSLACLLATGLLLLVGLLMVGRDSPTGPLLQYAAIAGVAEVSASAMYLVWVNAGGSPAFAAANTLMVLGAAAIPFSFRALRPTRVNLWCAILAAAGVVAVAVASLLLTVDQAVIVRAGAFALVGVCGAVAASRSHEAHRTSIRVFAGTLVAFAVYSAGRGAILAVADRDAATPVGPFSEAGAIIFGTIIILVLTAATSAHWLAVRRETLVVAAQSSAVLMTVPDARSGDTGRLPRFRELVDDVREAAAAIDSGAVHVFGGAGLSRAEAAAALKDTLRVGHGWTEEEIALLQQSVVER